MAAYLAPHGARGHGELFVAESFMARDCCSFADDDENGTLRLPGSKCFAIRSFGSVGVATIGARNSVPQYLVLQSFIRGGVCLPSVDPALALRFHMVRNGSSSTFVPTAISAMGFDSLRHKSGCGEMDRS